MGAAVVSVGHQQLAIKTDERPVLDAEVISLVPFAGWNWVSLQCVALQRQHEDTPAACLPVLIGPILFEVVILDEVHAVLHDAKARGPLPLARDRAAVLASERKDLQAIVPHVADE